jgi:hypothetical protein
MTALVFLLCIAPYEYQLNNRLSWGESYSGFKVEVSLSGEGISDKKQQNQLIMENSPLKLGRNHGF